MLFIPNSAGIFFEENTVSALRKLATSQGKTDAGLRLSVEFTEVPATPIPSRPNRLNPSGKQQYSTPERVISPRMSWATEPNTDDEVIEVEGLRVFIDRTSLPHLRGSRVQLSNDGGFHVHVPDRDPKLTDHVGRRRQSYNDDARNILWGKDKQFDACREDIAEVFAGTPILRVLDVGCGAAYLTQVLLEIGWDVSGVDDAEGMLKVAKESCPDTNFYLADASEEIPLFEDGHFSLIIGRLISAYICSPEVFSRWKKWLSPTGVVAVVDGSEGIGKVCEGLRSAGYSNVRRLPMQRVNKFPTLQEEEWGAERLVFEIALGSLP